MECPTRPPLCTAAGHIAGTVIGGTLGGSLAVKAPEGVLEWVFCFGMLYLARKTLAQARPVAKAAAAAVVGAPGK
jgi:uncharacterized membrane protein YfcA